jgi:predicted pyridoxine 5'-phosphate oxidase superfamily flavin-nucleotide-binding protein
MNERTRLQLRLQTTVEGLSVAAVSYYVVGLFGYLVKGLHDEGVPVDISLATALFVPVAVLAIWFVVRRIRAGISPATDKRRFPITMRGMLDMYHDGNRQLQDRFDSRRIADKLEEKLTRTAFNADDKAFIEGAAYFFLATADREGRPDCSFKGGLPGFVRVIGASELAFPDYDGNGMFKSLGNVVVNPNVGLLFIAMHDKPKRLRVNGSARVSDADPLLQETIGAQLIVRVEARAIFPNCPRYILPCR